LPEQGRAGRIDRILADDSIVKILDLPVSRPIKVAIREADPSTLVIPSRRRFGIAAVL